MLDFFRTRSRRAAVASNLYGSIVTAARDARFFTELGVPDTVEGRYEMIMIHMILVLERLRREPGDGEHLSRLLIERFVTDMDDSIREMGVGDLSVPRKVKRAAVGLYERAEAYRPALLAGDAEALSLLLAGRLDSGSTEPPRALAASVLGLASRLESASAESLFKGRLPD